MAEGEINVRTLTTFDTTLPADTVEWCPIEPYQHILACGTYELIKSESSTDSVSRRGKILLLRIASGGELELLQEIYTSALLDMKWLHVVDIENRILLAVADSIGYLQIYQLKNREKVELIFITKSKVSDDENIMALSLDWSLEKYTASSPCANTGILVSDSEGQISRFTWRETGDLTKEFTWPVHKFQAWIVASDYDVPFIFYSGGDDHRFLCFDIRTGSHPVAESKEHTAGVTSIQSNVKTSLLATGSYDENVRFWDKRNFAQPMSTLSLNGGIWRLKWDPFTRQYLLAACMRNGFSIVNHDTSVSTVVANYKEHLGLSYGCDWSFLRQPDVSRLNISGDTLMSTCSYEDHVLKISVIDFWPNRHVDEVC